MKKLKRLIPTLTAMLVAGVMMSIVGCKKSDGPPPGSVVDGKSGVQIDYPKLMAAFPNPSPEIQTSLREAQMGIRYGQHEKALMALEKVVNDPSLTPEQKKLASAVFEQVKAAAQKAMPASQ